MAIIAKDSKREFTPAPEGLHSAVCCDVVDLGDLDTPWGQKPKVEIYWQIEEVNPENQRPFMVRRRFTLSLHEKANLRSTLEAWRGRKFNKEELEGFDLEKLIGVNCQVQIIHNIADEHTVYANVQAIVPAAKNGIKLRVSEDFVRKSERDKRAELEKNPHGNDPFRAADEDVPF